MWMRLYYQNPNIELKNLAVGATMATWAITHVDEILASNPDVLFVDYSVNDPVSSQDEKQRAGMKAILRATHELLIRTYFENSTKPHAALAYMAMQRSFQRESYDFLADVYYPVCLSYGVPVVSARDAVWPNINVVHEELWPVLKRVHPPFQAHQLAADLMSFAWVSAELNETFLSNTTLAGMTSTLDIRIDLGPLRFPSESASALMSCPKGYLAALSNNRNASGMQPARPPSPGWYWVDQGGKSGWEYDLGIQHERRSLVSMKNRGQRQTPPSTKKPTTPSARNEIAKPKIQQRKKIPAASGEAKKVQVPKDQLKNKASQHAIPEHHHLNREPPTWTGPLSGIISFPLRFNRNNPTLVVEFMKSYANFGQAVIWATESFLNSSQDYSTIIETTARRAVSFAAVNRNYASSCRSEIARHPTLFFTTQCSTVALGTWFDTTVLDGRWDDESSQLVVVARKGGLVLEKDSHVVNTWFVAADPLGSFFSPMSKRLRASTPAGLPDYVDGEVHIMMCPWSTDRPRFKVLGLKSC